MTAWRLEWLRLVRTKRWIAIGGVFLFFGLLGPLTARYMGTILERYGGNLQVTVPPAVPVDGITQYVANAIQIGLLVAVIVAAGALAFDGTPQIGTFFRTRAERIADIVIPRFVVSAAAAAAGFLLGAIAALYETWVLIGSLPIGGWLAGTAYGMLYMVFAVAVVAAAAGMTRSRLSTVLAAIVVLLGLPILGLIPKVSDWLPSALIGAIDGVPRGESVVHYLGAGGVTVVAIGLCLWAGIRWAAAREL
jgi:ABC-2 type transport system permease protein